MRFLLFIFSLPVFASQIVISDVQFSQVGIGGATLPSLNGMFVGTAPSGPDEIVGFSMFGYYLHQDSTSNVWEAGPGQEIDLDLSFRVDSGAVPPIAKVIGVYAFGSGEATYDLSSTGNLWCLQIREMGDSGDEFVESANVRVFGAPEPSAIWMIVISIFTILSWKGLRIASSKRLRFIRKYKIV